MFPFGDGGNRPVGSERRETRPPYRSLRAFWRSFSSGAWTRTWSLPAMNFGVGMCTRAMGRAFERDDSFPESSPWSFTPGSQANRLELLAFMHAVHQA